LRHMGYLKKNSAVDRDVRGIIFAEEIDDKAECALSIIPAIEFRKYKLSVQLV